MHYSATAKAFFLATAASLAMVPVSALAQAAAVDNSDNVATPHDHSQIEDIVVTARRVRESAQRTPVSITTLSAEQIDRRAIVNASELGKTTPGLSVVPSATAPGGLQISLRAQVVTDTSAVAAGSTGIYLDDTFQGPSNIAGSLLDFSDLANVEVLKGPQGTLYGRNVTGGVVKFVTNKPTGTLAAEAKVGFGNYDRHYVNGMVNLPLAGDKLALRVVGTYDEHSGYSYDIRSKIDRDDMHRWMIRGELLARPADNLEILIEGYYAKGHDNGSDNRAFYLQPGVNTGSLNVIAAEHINGLTAADLAPIVFYGGAVAAGTATPGQLAAFGAAYGKALGALPAAQALVAAEYNAPRNQAQQNPNFPLYDHTLLRGATGTASLDLGSVNLKSITAYVYGSTDRQFNVGGSSFIPIVTDQDGFNRQFSQEFQVNGKALGSRLKYALGFFYLRSTLQDDRNQSSRDGAFPLFLGQLGLGLTSGSVNYNTTLITSNATYGQFTYAITDAIHFTGGLRYTDESSKVTTYAYQLPNFANGLTTTCLAPAPNTAGAPLAQCTPVTAATNFTNWTYTAGLDWSIARDVMVYAKTSRGFKAGGVNAFGAAGAPILSYAPEKNTDYEVGVKADFLDHHGRFNLTYFHTNYDNIQRTIAFLASPGVIATAIQNAAKAKIDGIEIESSLKPLPGLTLGGTFAYTDPRYINYIVKYADGVTPKDQSGFPFQSVAKYTYSLTAAYDLPIGANNVHAQVDWSHRSSAVLFENDLLPSTPGGTDFVPRSALTQPAYGLLDLSLSADIPALRSRVTVWGKNVLNKRYLVSMVSLVNNGVGTGWGNFGPPATVGVDWKVTF